MRTLSILLYILIFDAAIALLDTQLSGDGEPGPHTPSPNTLHECMISPNEPNDLTFDRLR